MVGLVYLDGSLVPSSQAKVSAFDQGFLYGYGLFETMRAYNGHIFRLNQHLERLMWSAQPLGLWSKLLEIDLAQACLDTVQANNLQDARVRLTVSRGEIAGFPGSDTDARPTVLVTAMPYSPLPSKKYRDGFSTLFSSYRRDSGSPLSHLKSANYLSSLLAKKEAETAGLDEALVLNEKGYLTEGSVSNLFVLKADSALVTPPLLSGVLPGITRGVVMEMAPSLGLTVTEADIELGDLRRCGEAFLTNSMIEIMPLASVKDREGGIITIGSGRQGGSTKKLMTAYKELVVKETT